MNEDRSNIVGSGITTVFVIAGVCLYREGLREVLDRQPDIDVVGVAASVPAALQPVAAERPHVVLVDQPADLAATVVSAIHRAHAQARIVVVGISDTERDVVAWAEAGVSGYVTRDDSLDALIKTVHAVANQELLCTPWLAATLLRRVAILARRGPDDRVQRDLTTREHEVLALLERGLSNKEIAHRLSIALPTVKNHVHNILEKLQARGRGEAVAWLHSVPAATR